MTFHHNLNRFMAAAIIGAGASLFVAQAARHEPYDRSRIYWDQSTRCLPLPNSGSYGRMIQLQDGRLMVMGGYAGGVAYTFSSDYGKTWTSPQLAIRNPEGFGYGSPDFTQLADGTLLLGLNPRPTEPYTEDRKFGIRVTRSTDLGKTWSEPIFVYDAQHLFGDGVWEPSFLQLPSGEVHCYFSDEGTFTQSSEQDIKVSRSFDNGLTWSTPQRISFRPGCRDGMPSAIITDAGEIVVIIEDFGHGGYSGFRATTFRCTLEENWSYWVDGNSPNRNMIFANAADKKYASAAPYIRKMQNGETVASWMGEKEGLTGVPLDLYPMFVAVGDADARNFKSVNQSCYFPEGGCANWASVGVADDGYGYAQANTYGGGHTPGLGLVKGMPRKGFEAAYGTPKIDGTPAKDAWAYKNGKQLTMGSQTGCRTEADFLYDDENFYFYAYVMDNDIVTDAIDNDGVFLYLDVAGCCDTYPQEGIFRFFFNVDGTVTMHRGQSGKWQAVSEPEGMTYVMDCHKRYYMMEVAIPWALLGEQGAPSSSREMRVNLKVRDRRKSALLFESIPDAIDKSSWTWPELTLLENAGIGGAGIQDGGKTVFRVEGCSVAVEATREVKGMEAYTPAGMLAAVSPTSSIHLPGKGIYIIGVRYADGSVERRKVSI